MTFEHDPDLAAELRQGAGREWTEEAAEDERLTALHDRRRLGLSEMAKEMANRGSRVSLDVGGHPLSGLVTEAGADYAVVEGSGVRSEVRLDATVWSVIPAGPDASPGKVIDETLQARLNEYSDQGTTVRIVLPSGELMIGKIVVVADDHVELADADGRNLYVPLKMVLAVMRSTEFH